MGSKEDVVGDAALATSAPSTRAVDTSSAATTTTTAAVAHKLPPAETSDQQWQRKLVVFSFWAIVVFLGIPVWWRTTMVYRAGLPTAQMNEWATRKVCNPVFPLSIDLNAGALNIDEANELLRATQHALDDLNDFSAHHLRLSIAKPDAVPLQDREAGSAGAEQSTEPPALTVELIEGAEGSVAIASLDTFSPTLKITYAPSMAAKTSASPSTLGTFIAHQLQGIFAEEQAIIAYLMTANGATSGSQQQNRLSPEVIASLERRSTRALKYAPIYHLTFSLLTPDASPFAWDIDGAIRSTLQPLLDSLSTITNFTIDTQVQPYAAFAPSLQPMWSEEHRSWLLDSTSLGGFINAAEWPLSPSIGIGPTINFILFVPSQSQSPLHVANSNSDSWLIPQWGGVAIYNRDQATSSSLSGALSKSDLQPALLAFSHQLLTLLGLPSSTGSSLPLRLSTLSRVWAASLMLSASSTLGSLARLTDGLPSISIPDSVAESVDTTLTHLDSACAAFRGGHFQAALHHGRVAEAAAEKAFFERSMVGQVYFPDEHKVAVYLPLLGPVAVPLLMSLVREVKPLLKRRIKVG